MRGTNIKLGMLSMSRHGKYTHTVTHTLTHTQSYTHTHSHTHTHTHSHTHTHTHTHSHTHTHTHTLSVGSSDRDPHIVLIESLWKDKSNNLVSPTHIYIKHTCVHDIVHLLYYVHVDSVIDSISVSLRRCGYVFDTN